MLYEWIKALHVISIIAWMAGLLYLPRLFVYHCEAPAGSETSETLKVMERRLLRAIMNPAMIAAYVFGITMIVLTPEWLKQGWLHAKILFVLLLTASHMMMARWRRDFAEDRNTRPQRFYRIANEVPTLLMIGIVIFVIVKPF
ncbi:putative membrane protein [Azospirillum oryzae]|uniref:Protoporphyrinogen IX oxidase n=1 Tax=Azospirillum oryzae TaxID=286727 RepID=A0A1X7G211_9PROT|nr:protoporphyrinogen oxidase HemJ [Azospirillum oryzae]SMF62574.1 putative membrane protein [Azospirillum oryzae]